MNAKVWVGLKREEGSYGKIPPRIASRASSESRKNGERVGELMTAAEGKQRRLLIVSSDQVAASDDSNSHRYLKFDLSLILIARSILASAVMALCIWLIAPESIVMAIVSILAGIIIYFGLLLLIRGLS